MHFKGPIVNFFDGRSLSRHKVRFYILQVPNNETLIPLESRKYSIKAPKN